LDKWDDTGKVFKALADLDLTAWPPESLHIGGRHYIVVAVKNKLFIAEYTFDPADPLNTVIVKDLERYKWPKGLRL